MLEYIHCGKPDADEGSLRLLVYEHKDTSGIFFETSGGDSAKLNNEQVAHLVEQLSNWLKYHPVRKATLVKGNSL